MLTTNPREAQRLVDASGARAWLALVERYGKTFRHGSIIVTCEPDAVRALLLERPHTERRPPVHRFMGAFPGADGIVFMDGAPWRTRIKALAPVFRRDTVDSHGEALHALADAHARRWQQQGGGGDLFGAVQQFGAAAILQAGYGMDPGDPLAQRLIEALIRWKNNSTQPVPALRYDRFHIGPATIARLPRMAWTMWRDFARVRRVVREVLRARASNGDRPDWIGRLADAGLSEGELARELNHLYMAYNAIDHVATAAFYELGRRLPLQAAIRAELRGHLGGRGRVLRGELDRLPITRGFLLEVLRCYPVSMGIARLTGAPLRLGGEQLPAGTQVLILLHALQHHPDYWDDGEEFRPERWTTTEPRVPFSYVPFLLGTRRCQGRDMAEQQLLTLVAAVVQRLELRIEAEVAIPPLMIPRFGAPIPFVAAVHL